MRQLVTEEEGRELSQYKYSMTCRSALTKTEVFYFKMSQHRVLEATQVSSSRASSANLALEIPVLLHAALRIPVGPSWQQLMNESQ